MALADKVQEKRDKSKQKALDGKQDGEIKAMQDKLQKLEADNKDKEGKLQQRSRSSSRSSGRRRRRRRDDYDEDDDDAAYYARSARRSKAMIEQMYEDKLMRMGQGYAQGDGQSFSSGA